MWAYMAYRVPWYTRFHGLEKWNILWGTTHSDTSMYWTLSGDSSFHNRTVCRPNFWTLLSPNSPCRESFSCEHPNCARFTRSLLSYITTRRLEAQKCIVARTFSEWWDLQLSQRFWGLLSILQLRTSRPFT